MRQLVVVCCLVACGDKQESVKLGAVAAQPFGVFADVSLGMTIDEVKQKVSGLTLGKDNAYALVNRGGASYTAEFRDGKVSKLKIQVFKRPPSALVAAWGQGTPADKSGDRFHYYNATRTVRADIYNTSSGNSFAITFLPMQTLASVLGDGTDATKLLGVELLHRPLGAVIDDLNKRGYDCKPRDTNAAHCMRLPAIEVSLGDSGNLGLKASPEGTVMNVHMFWTLDPVDTAKQFVLDAYKTKWGEPKTDRGRLQYKDEPRVYADPTQASLSIDTE